MVNGGEFIKLPNLNLYKYFSWRWGVKLTHKIVLLITLCYFSSKIKISTASGIWKKKTKKHSFYFYSNFSNYKARFTPPTGPDQLYYSFNIGPAHIISFSTEYYYFLNYGIKSLVKQYDWLVEDLQVSISIVNRDFTLFSCM